MHLNFSTSRFIAAPPYTTPHRRNCLRAQAHGAAGGLRLRAAANSFAVWVREFYFFTFFFVTNKARGALSVYDRMFSPKIGFTW